MSEGFPNLTTDHWYCIRYTKKIIELYFVVSLFWGVIITLQKKYMIIVQHEEEVSESYFCVT